MGKVLFGVLVAVASLMLVDSLTCNTCSFSLFGFCVNSGTMTCTSNTSVCFTGRATFPSISSSFSGFNTQGCREPAGCNATTNGTLLTVTYMTTIQCCSTDRCNPVDLTGDAPSTRVTLTATLGAAVLASVWGSML